MTPPVLAISGVLGLLVIGLGGFSFWSYSGHERTKQELGATQTELASTTAAYIKAQETLAEEAREKEGLSKDLDSAKEENRSSVQQLASLADKVETLDKLANTDKQLLEKYSKVYFLNENYIPSKLGTIDSEYVLEEGRELEFHGDALPYLERMLKAAEKDTATLKVVSAYRSFGTQAELKASYRLTYGVGANRFSAEQGYSEHQLGTTLDLTTPAIAGLAINFDTSPGYKWLTENAWRYGFILSYPKGNAYYQYEPWHWRFVGTDLAEKLHDENKYFYDLDQREIDTYLVSLFD
ncbi:MAG: peptidase and DD-carboxypeptidase VanY/endolysin [Parcubacteria group bacterium]|nr:peptidase and DD-carboxypeptidase VanY/endolysin [Parcubacteria group bacterium]